MGKKRTGGSEQTGKAQRQAQEALDASEAKYRDLVDNALVGVYTSTLGGDLIYANQALATMLGFASPQEIMSAGVLARYRNQEDREALLRELRERGKVETFEVDLLTKAREPRHVLLSAALAGEQLSGMIMDITERRRAEEASVLLARAVEQSGEAILITDPDGVIEYVNPAFEKITGYLREEALGRTPRILKSGSHNEAFYRELWDTIGSGRQWSGLVVNKRKDGSHYEEETTISPVRDAAGGIAHYVAVKRDITAQRKLEEQLRQAQKMEAIGRLAGGVAHDFNNLLTAIQGYGQLLLSDLDSEDERRHSVREILRAAERAASLTHQLLAFSRRQVLQPVVLDLNSVVRDLEKLLRRLIGEDVELVTFLDSQPARTRADAGQVEQIVMNLAVNARDAMPQGGRLTIETRTVDLDAEYAERHIAVSPGPYVLLAVSDTGSGMDAETQSQIFEPFFTTKESSHGTGLGLSTVYGIVKQSGGNIWVYSEPGRGTTFKIYLPRIEGGAAEVKSAEAAIQSLRGSETILLVEDDKSVRDVVQRMLALHGYRVLKAANAAQALRVSERHKGPIHLLVTDVVLPQMGGRELAEELARRRPEMVVLYVSGYADNAIVHHGVLDPGTAFLQKPLSQDALLRKVRQLLGPGEPEDR